MYSPTNRSSKFIQKSLIHWIEQEIENSVVISKGLNSSLSVSYSTNKQKIPTVIKQLKQLDQIYIYGTVYSIVAEYTFISNAYGIPCGLHDRP